MLGLVISLRSTVALLAAIALLLVTTVVLETTTTTVVGATLGVPRAVVAAAAAAAAVSSTTTESASASSTARAIFGGPVYTDGSSVKLGIVHTVNGLLGIFILAVSDEAKASAAASIAIFDDHSFLDSSEFFELGAKSVLVSVP